jgi:hypothetical protein
MSVLAQFVFFSSYHQTAFAMRLQSRQAIHHVHANLLHLPGPLDVRLLIEPGFQLNERSHLLPIAGRIHQGFHDR